MSNLTPSCDVAAVCVILADYDLDTSIETVVQRAEKFQNDHDRHFGITQRDFRRAFHVLVLFEMEMWNESPTDEYEARWERAGNSSLRDLIKVILDYDCLYCNDEGEHWDREDRSRWHLDIGLVPTEYSARNRAMRTFFADPATCTRESIVQFFEGEGIGEVVLISASREGGGS